MPLGGVVLLLGHRVAEVAAGAASPEVSAPDPAGDVA